MEIVLEHMMEPAVSGPPPRRAGLPLRTNLLLVAAVMLFACFIYGAGRALLVVFLWQSPPTGKIVFLMLCGGLVIGVSAVLLKKIFQWRQHRVRLLRHGIATIGTIVDKQARAEDAPRYYIRYGYAAGADLHEREEQVSIDQWKRLQVGQPVSVLYDPERRFDAGLYLLIAKG